MLLRDLLAGAGPESQSGSGLPEVEVTGLAGVTVPVGAPPEAGQSRGGGVAFTLV